MPSHARAPSPPPAPQHDAVPHPAASAPRPSGHVIIPRWDDLLYALETKRAMLAGHYQHARVLVLNADTLEVGFPEEAHMSGELAREPGAQAAMRDFLREQVGRPMNLSVKLLSAAESAQAPARSLIESSREKAAEERRKRETEAREHPVTKLVLETFGAQIKEIKTDV
jgi:hypothetical protein